MFKTKQHYKRLITFFICFFIYIYLIKLVDLRQIEGTVGKPKLLVKFCNSFHYLATKYKKPYVYLNSFFCRRLIEHVTVFFWQYQC